MIPGIVAAAAIIALVAAAILVVERALPGTTQPRGAEQSSAPVAGSADLDCADGDPVAQQLSSGSTWSMCWRVDPSRGLVLEDVHFAPAGRQPVQVLAELSIGQLEVPYDSGMRTTEDISSQGFGGTKMMSLTEEECLGERVTTYVPRIGDGSTGGGGENRAVLCREVVDGGIAYRSGDALGGAEVTRRMDLRLSTISKVGWYEYVSQYTFGSDGSIRSDLGATGDLSPEDYGDDPDHGWPVGPGKTDYATSHSHNAVWRVHWALGGSGGQVVEQYDAAPTGETGPRSPVVDGGLTRITHEGTAKAADRRWWRVVNPAVLNDDEHAISYQVDLGATTPFEFTKDHDHPDGGAHGGAEGGYDIAFTEADDCQVVATSNPDRTCGAGVLDFAKDQAELSDVVTWVAVGFHHVARDEDQSPMEMHWQGFTLTPRDLTAQRADPPSDRADVNGKPTQEP